MCGRYVLYGPKRRVLTQFDATPEDPTRWPDDEFGLFNIAPSQWQAVIRWAKDGGRVLTTAQWGLVPAWAKDPAKMAHPINAKLETATEKPMFRHAFRRSRIIVPASGFYEWKPVDGYKQPYFIRPAGDELFGFAGLLEERDGPEGKVQTFALLTTAANELMAQIHDRMPVILQPSAYADWLDPAVSDPNLVRALAGEFPAEMMTAYAVGRAVGNPRSQGAALIDPLPAGA